MNWLRRLLGKAPTLTVEQQLALVAHHAQPVIDGVAPLATLRFVVADVETTGLQPYSDRLISIGAVVVEHRAIRLSESFEVVFRQPQASNTANILIHGIDGTTQLAGRAPAAAMLEFLDYAGAAPLVGYHADFDRVMINREAGNSIGSKLANDWLDLAFLAPAVFDTADTKSLQTLDDWLQRFGIHNHARHNALADALATAQLLQVVLARAMADGAQTLRDLMQIEQNQRWLSRR